MCGTVGLNQILWLWSKTIFYQPHPEDNVIGTFYEVQGRSHICFMIIQGQGDGNGGHVTDIVGKKWQPGNLVSGVFLPTFRKILKIQKNTQKFKKFDVATEKRPLIELQAPEKLKICPGIFSNKPENQDEDALGKIEQQQDFVILELGASIKVGVHL